MAGGGSLLVAAIDFGTTYSGWAFSFKHEFDKDPTKVSAKQWLGGQLVSLKGPTCVLIKPDGKTLHSFGYDAETKYADLVTEDDHTDWYFFRRFKMLLFDKQGLGRNDLLEDESGKKLSTKTVFSLSIKYLRDDLIKMSENRISGGGLKDDDIHWVLTVPAIWNDAAKQFMREAAQEAGIPGNKLTIALEPEAASLYCRHLPVEKCGSDKTSLASFGPGKRYLVLDAGGGTVDITVHEVMDGGHLRELHKASGGAWGGTKVDDAFLGFLNDLAGSAAMSKLKDENMEDYLDIFRDFELKKRQIGLENDTKITLRVPTVLVEHVKLTSGKSLQERIDRSQYAGQIKLMGDKLRVEQKVARGFFETSVNSITHHLQALFRELGYQNIEAIVMVGGYSESPILQDKIRSNFKNMRIIVPEEAGLAVLKGAVIFGHSPESIAERVSKYTYGTDVRVPFDPDVHDLEKMVIKSDGSEWCDDVFSIFVEAGDTLVIGEAHEEDGFSPDDEFQTEMGMDIYATLDTSPSYVDDPGCSLIGSFSVPLSGSGRDRSLIVRMIFGGTEIVFECLDVATGEITNLSIDFLS